MANAAYVLSILMLTLAIPVLPVEPGGVISARVFDQNGSPVAGAVVEMEPSDGRVVAGAVPECLTDESGACSCDKMQFGKYRATAMKTADRYPDQTFGLYGHDKKPLVVEITPETPVATASITLGPKAASIALKVVEDGTGLPVKSPSVTLRLAESPNVFLSVGSNLNSNILVPPDEDILVEVSAEGHKSWQLETQPGATHANALHLHSEEKRDFTVRLQPK